MDVPALARLKELQSESDKADAALKKLGGTMDRVGGPKSKAQLRSYRDAIKDLGTQSTSTANKVSTNFDRMEKSIAKNTAKAKKEIQALRLEIEELGHTNATASVGVDTKSGLAGIKAMRREMAGLAKDAEGVERISRRIGRDATPGGSGGGGGSSSPMPRVRSSSGGGGRGGSPIRKLASGGGQIPLGFTSVTPRTFALLLPAAQQLGGAFLALASSAASAAAGLGAIGTAAAGAGIAGVGSIAAIAVPALSRIGAASKARAALTAAKQPGFANTQQQIANTQAVQAAEQGLTQAQRQAKTAQDQLTQSRRDAVRQLTDMRLAAKSAALAERGATISLGRAKLALQQTRENPLATGFDRSDAQLAYDQAKLAKTQSVVDVNRAKVDNRRTQSRGVRRDPGVVQAGYAVQDSKFALSNAQVGLKQATQELVRGSSQIAQAKSDLNRAFAMSPQGTKQLLSDVQKLKTAFGAGDKGAKGGLPKVREAQRGFLTFLDGGVKTLFKLRNTVAGAGLSGVHALNHQAPILESFLAGPDTKRWIKDSAGAFAENLGNVRRVLVNIAKTFQNISEAARPFLKESTDWLARTTGKWATQSSNLVKTRSTIRKMVSDLRDWKNLLGASGRLLKDVFSQGRGSGSSMVRDLTKWLNTQDRFIQRNPQKVRQFFANAVSSTQKMATAMWQIVKALSTLGTTLRPLLDMASTLVARLGPLMQLAGLPGGLALGAAGVSALRGRGGGGGGAKGVGLLAGAAGLGRGARGAISDYRLLAKDPAITRRAAAATVLEGGGTGLAGAAGGAARLIGKRVLPITALFAGLDYARGKGTHAQKAQFAAGNAINPITQIIPKILGFKGFNAIAPVETPEQRQARINAQGANAAIPVLRRGIGASTQRIATLRSHLAATAGITGLDNSPFKGRIKDARGASQAQINALVKGIKQETDARRSLVQQLHAEAADRSRALGHHAAANYQARYVNDRKNMGVTGAFGEVSGASLQHLSHMGPAGGRVFAQDMLNWAEKLRKKSPQITAQVTMLSAAITKRFQAMGKSVSVVNGQILTGSQKEWSGISGAITDSVQSALPATSKAFAALKAQALGSLKAMGYSTSQAQTLFTGVRTNTFAKDKSGAAILPSAGALGSTHARGGRLQGTGMKDTVPLAAGGLGAPGELVVNRHTESKANRVLGMFGTTLGRMVGHETRRHDAPMYATGGRAVNFDGHPSNVSAPIRRLIGDMEKRWPQLGVTSTTDHSLRSSSGGISYHSSGRAVDMAGPPAYMNKVARWINSSGFYRHLTEGIHNPTLSVKNGQKVPPSFWGPVVWPQHLNHIHMALAGALGAFPGGRGGGGGIHGSSVKLKAPLSGLAGVPGGLADAAALGLASGLQRKINSRLSAAGRSNASDPGTGLTFGDVGSLRNINHTYKANGKTAFSPALVARIAKWAGLPGQTFAQIAHGESSYMPGAVEKMEKGGAQGFGLWQITTGVGNDSMINRLGGSKAMLNPLVNAKAARSLYDSAGHSIRPWHGTRYVTNASKGARLPSFGGWYGNGGSMTASHPTMIGVGDRQPVGHFEEASVTRRKVGDRGGAHPAIHVSVNMGGVVMHGGGTKHEVQEMADKVADVVARKLTVAMKEAYA